MIVVVHTSTFSLYVNVFILQSVYLKIGTVNIYIIPVKIQSEGCSLTHKNYGYGFWNQNTILFDKFDITLLDSQ